MLKNAYSLAKIGADTAENELNFTEILPIGAAIAAPAVRVRVSEAPTTAADSAASVA